MFPELTRKPHPTHEQSRYSFSSVHNVELGNSMKEEEEEDTRFGIYVTYFGMRLTRTSLTFELLTTGQHTVMKIVS